ncbi:diphosphomevalonate decarboxylase [Mollisia scopiformis]|uniref:Diphosphomevalonate decarboxylase n=1 Tax=Mollisia scopiformis TaxID=149040 RepID=A0A194WVS4_MOLSC|nr:diphosphomevalonate decarboxylase [Mollisia scopiformis]KUJ12071.1 diphosphomevalonate decarboxylase [Mollisia scopiformis]
MADKKIYQASTTAPVNIAVVKYWGKRDPKLNLPTNSSVSVTLSQADLRTHTTAACSSSFGNEDTLLLNSSPQDVTGARTQACFRELRALRSSLEASDSSLPKLSTLPLRIVSENNFPTAAGLASSAAGFAALVRAIANLYELPSSPTDLSRIARQGSGSACRSLFGGYVAWQMGSKADGSDSVAVEVAPASHWPTMRALILVVSAEKKGVSSTSGMQITVATSKLFKHRAEVVVPQHMEMMEKAIKEKDFETFAKVTMMDSNSFHSVCLDTFPPIFYLNDVSRSAIRVVEDINKKAGKIVAAYTFDAGPNAVIYFEEENVEQVAGVLKSALGSLDGWQGRDIKVQDTEGVDAKAVQVLKEGVSRVILTSVGEGPIRTEESLIAENGEPLKK